MYKCDGVNLHTGVNLLLGANCAHEQEDSFIPFLKQITKSIMEIVLETSLYISRVITKPLSMLHFRFSAKEGNTAIILCCF